MLSGLTLAVLGLPDDASAQVIIQGTDNGNEIEINSISVNIAAEDDYFVGMAKTLSETIYAAGEEPQVLFTQNWDIRLDEYNTETGTAIIKIGKLCS